MAHKRIRNGKYHYTISSKLLPNGRVYLTFVKEQEGDDYTKKLDELLVAGKVPVEFMAQKGATIILADAIDFYINTLDVPESDQLLLKNCQKTPWQHKFIYI